MHLIRSLLTLCLAAVVASAADPQSPLQTAAPTKVLMSMDCYSSAEDTVLRCDRTSCPPCSCDDPDCDDPSCDSDPPCECDDPDCDRTDCPDPDPCADCDTCDSCPAPEPVTVTATKTVTVYSPDCSDSPTDNCTSPATSWPLRRMWNGAVGDHFYATSGPEIGSAGGNGFVEELPAGRVFLTQVEGTVPLYRCFWNLPAFDHFYTAKKNEYDKAVADGCLPLVPVNGIIGYVYQKKMCGAMPLYRLYNAAIHDHFYTPNKAERNTAIKSGGYKSEGIAGYVLPV